MRDHALTRLAGGFQFLEGLRWHDGHLWASDMLGNQLVRIAPDGSVERLAEVPGRPSGIGFLPDGVPVVVSMVDRKLMRLVDGELLLHADLSALASGDLNDMVMDAAGQAYVGNFGYDLFGGADPALADLHLVQADGTASVAASGLNFPNGCALIDQGRTLVVAETWAGHLTAFDRAADGSLSNRRVHADLAGRTPDGICADAADGLWVGSIVTGEFLRVDRGGEITDRADCAGKRGVACALGGDDGRTLYCATFDGELADIGKAQGRGAIETLRVEIPAPGFA